MGQAVHQGLERPSGTSGAAHAVNIPESAY